MITSGVVFVLFHLVIFSDVQPQNKEDKEPKQQEVVDVVAVVGLGQLENLPDRVADDGLGRVEPGVSENT